MITKLNNTLISRSLLGSLSRRVDPQSARAVRRGLSVAVQRGLIVVLVLEVDEGCSLGLALLVHQYTHIHGVHAHGLQNERGLISVYFAQVSYEH